MLIFYLLVRAAEAKGASKLRFTKELNLQQKLENIKSQRFLNIISRRA